MAFRVLKLSSCLSLLCILSGCALKPLHYENASELSKIEEFDKIVQVKELPAEETAKVPSDPTKNDLGSSSKKEKPPEQKIIEKPIKKAKKNKKEDEARQPTIEDAEGFSGRRPIQDPFRVGEKVTMMMTYFGVSAGDMILTTKPLVEVNGRKSYRFHVNLRSSDLFSMFYFVEDWGETFVDYETLLPASMEIAANESKKLLALKSAFDHRKNQAFRWERQVQKDEPPREQRKEWEILPYSQNVISAFWYIRTFKLYPGKTINFRVADDKKNMVVKVEVLRREKIKTLKGEFNTIVLKPTVEIGGIFQPMGSVLFWLTDDDRKIFVRMEAEIRIGKVIGQLKDLELGGP